MSPGKQSRREGRLPMAGDEEGEGEEELAERLAEVLLARLDDRFFRGISTHVVSSPFRTHLVHGRKESQPVFRFRQLRHALLTCFRLGRGLICCASSTPTLPSGEALGPPFAALARWGGMCAFIPPTPGIPTLTLDEW